MTDRFPSVNLFLCSAVSLGAKRFCSLVKYRYVGIRGELVSGSVCDCEIVLRFGVYYILEN